MKRFFVHDDGRLKTGRIAFLVFISVIVGCTLVFYMGKPADKALLAVKHVFEAEKKPAPTDQPPPQPSKQEESETVEDQEDAAVEEPETPPAAESSAAPGRQTPDKPDVGAPDGAPDGDSERNPDETSDEVPDKALREDRDEDRDEDRGEDPAERVGETESRDLVKSIPDVQPEDRARDEGEAGEVVLAPSDYLAVHNSWRESGAQASGEGNIPLRVENLKAVYSLFQMKAVALRGENPYVDLSDGTRIAEGALNPYSTTCFLAAEPFKQWGPELKDAGFTPADRVKVRYYMYDSIRNAIYARAASAFECCRQKGLIPEGVSADAVDVLGRAYAIKREGGGGFGVFVPIRIDLPDGRSIAVDPACFQGSADIDHLLASGKLR